MSCHSFSCVSVLQPSWLRLEYFHHWNDTSWKQPLTIPPFGPSNHSPAFVFAVCGTCCISRISHVPTSRLIFFGVSLVFSGPSVVLPCVIPSPPFLVPYPGGQSVHIEQMQGMAEAAPPGNHWPLLGCLLLDIG